MKTINLTVNEVVIVKSVIATVTKSVKSDLRGSDIVTKKLFDEIFVALESINERIAPSFTVTPFEGSVLTTIINTTVASLKSDARGANQITKRMLAEQINGLESVVTQINPVSQALNKEPDNEPIDELDTVLDKEPNENEPKKQARKPGRKAKIIE